MRVRGDIQPDAPFTLEEQPKKPGYLLARFYEHTVPFEELLDGAAIQGYEYDEYQLELGNTGGLDVDIANNLAVYVAQAKSAERGEVPEPLFQSDMEALAIDHEYRLTLLELGVI